MDDLGGVRLAGACLSEDEGDGFRPGGLGHFLAQAAHGRAVPHEPLIQGRLQIGQPRLVHFGFFFQIRQLALERFKLRHVADRGDHAADVSLAVKNGRAGVEAALPVGIVVKHGHGALFGQSAEGDAG